VRDAFARAGLRTDRISGASTPTRHLTLTTCVNDLPAATYANLRPHQPANPPEPTRLPAPSVDPPASTLLNAAPGIPRPSPPLLTLSHVHSPTLVLGACTPAFAPHLRRLPAPPCRPLITLSAAALRETLPSVEAKHGHVVICGGGPTGIEIAAEVATTYPHIKVHLVTQGPFSLFLGKTVASSIRRSLTRVGVEIIDQTAVAAVRAHSVVIDQAGVIPCDLGGWAGGFVASSLAREAGLAVNERNQIIVDPFLRSISHPEIYAIGDAAHPREDPGVPVRMSAVTATIMGAHGADCLSAVLRGKTPRPLSFAYLGQGIALGRRNAIGFNNYPDDKPNPPYFTGWLGYQIREGFVRLLATAVQHGAIVWPGKRRYERAQHRQQAKAQKDSMQLHRV